MIFADWRRERTYTRKNRKDEDFFGIEGYIRSFNVSDLYPPKAGRAGIGGKMLYWKGWGAKIIAINIAISTHRGC